ncbi:MAG: glycosyltransferase family A protein, partial [Oligoflexia bacterium]|nr:glycosyltransferase family A protein [Oligoflexia bacterium]
MAKKIQHLVDIIIPSYNRKQLLKRAVTSVYKQSHQNWRLFIVDDGSTDGTSEEFYGNKTQLLELKKNKGVSYARNYGIKN